MNRSPKPLARNLIVLSLTLTGLIFALVVAPGLRRFAASSADATRTTTATPIQQTAGTPMINGVNANRIPMATAGLGMARQPGRGSLLLPALRARKAAAGVASPFAPVITATLADALQVDNNNSGKADPGDTLMYTVTITNSGSDATGVTFTDDLSQNGGNLTLVAGSVMSAPVARPDAYPNGIGNTRMTVNAANGVLVNDFDPDGTTPTAVPITNGATTGGGTVNLAADGSFTYDPPVNVTGTTDTFTYTATDGVKTDTAVVTITLAAMVWYVDNTYVGATSDGRSATPFKTLTPVNGPGGAGDADGPGHYIYVRENGGGAYTGGLQLENNQILIGNGVALVVNAQTLIAAGSKPTITNSGGNGVTLATDNTVRGLIAQTTTAGGASAGIAGSSVGNFSADTLQAVGNPGAAVDIQTAGTLAVTFESLSSTNGTRGMRLTSATGGTFTVTGTTTTTGTTGDGVILTGGNPTVNFTGGVSITTASGRGIVASSAGTLNVGSGSIDATFGAALDLQSMNLGSGLIFSLLKSTNSSAEGIKMSGCIQNLTATTTNIQTPTGNGIDIQSTFGTSTLSFGNTTVNKTAAGIGVNLINNGTATVGFGALNITTGAGSALVGTTSGTVNSTSGTISATAGPALNLSAIKLGLTLTSVTSTNSPAEGIKIATCNGPITVTTTNIQTPTGNGIDVQGHTLTSTLNFGNTTVNKTAAGIGINLISNGTSTVSFGTLSDTTGAGSGLVATTSGTVNSTSGTISATAGPAMNLSAVTAGLTLTSASSTNSTGTGITLATVAGSVTIGTTTITNPTGIGINATSNTASLNFGNTTANGSGGTGIVLGGSGTGNTGTISFGSLDMTPDNNQRGLLAQENTNTITITSGTIITTGSPNASGQPAIEITRPSSTTPLAVSLTKVTVNGSGSDGIILTRTSGSFTITGDGGSTNNSSGGTIQNTTGNGIALNTVQNISLDQMNIQSTGANGIGGTQVTNFTLTNSTLNNSGNGSLESNVAFNNFGTGLGNNINGTLTITNNTLTNAFYSGVDIQSDNGTLTNATISNNTITSSTVAANSQGFGINFNCTGSASTVFNLNNATISGNTITNFPTASGIQINGGNGSGSGPGGTIGIPNDGTKLISITGNTIKGASAANLMAGNAIIIAVQSTNSGSRSQANVNIANNGTVANPITNIGGTVIGVGCNGYTTMAATVTNNVIVANHVPNLGGPNGIGGGPGPGGAGVTSTPALTITASNNNISQTDGNGILLVARGDNGSMNIKIASNTVAAPINAGGTARQGIRVDSGNQTAGESTTVCLNITGNTSAGSNAAAGIGIRKEAADPFGLTGLSPSPATGAQMVSFVNTNNPAGGGTDNISTAGGDGTNYTSCSTAPASVTPDISSAMQPQSVKSDDQTDATDSNATLKAHHGPVEPGNGVRQILLPEVVWMGQQAIQRWHEMGISAEDLARLNAVTFEIGHLPAGQIAALRGTTVVIDEIAAGYGWYFDQNPYDDSEFDVPVFDRERQATELSPAYGKMDLLTALMRELGTVYLQGKEKTPKKLRPLMNPLLLPGVRRMTPDQWKVALPSPIGSMQTPVKETVQGLSSAPAQSAPAPVQATPNRQPATAQVEGERAEASARPNDFASAARYAVYHPAANQPIDTASPRPVATSLREVAVMGIHESSPEPEDMPTLRNASMTTQKAKGQKTFVPTSVLAGGIVSVGPFNLPAGETVTIMFNATIDTPVVPPGTTSVCTQGKVTYTGGPAGGVLTTDPGPPSVNGPTCTTLAQANLSVTKTDSPDPVFSGSDITYTVTATNNGLDSAFNVSLTDAIPANTTFVSTTTPAGWTRTDSVAVGGTGTLSFTKPSMTNGEMATFTIVVNVNASTAGGTIITNNAVIASDTPDGTQGNNTGTATTTVTAQADLEVTKTDSPDPVTAGNNLTYTINFTNHGPGTAQTVTVTDAVPANTTFVSSAVTTGSGWTKTEPAVGGTGNVVFSKASVPNGETAVFTIVVKVNANTANGTTISNSAVAASTTTDPTPGNNTGMASTTVQTSADLALTKSDAPDPVTSGNNITYTIGFTNNGPSDAQTVTVTDAVPANTTFVSSAVTTGSGWTKTEPAVGGTGNVVFSKATVAAGETATFTIVVKVGSNVGAGVTISNSATAASATTDPTSSNDTASTTTTTQTAADLVVTKTDSPDPVNAGNNITYTINFSNAGPSDAQTVTVTDAVPANTTFVSSAVTTGSGWTKTEPAVGGTGNVVFSKATVAAGETATFTIVVKVNSNTASGTTISNSATAASTTTDPTPGNNTGMASTTVQTSADLAVTKTDTPDPSFAGNNITYTIGFTNNGPSDAQTVTVTDAVPANTTFVSSAVTTGSGWTKTEPAVGGTGNVVFSKATVAAGETATFTIVVKVDAMTPTGTTITNTATAATTTTDPTPGNNSATATTDIQAQANLTLDKVASPSPDVIAGNNITYTLTLSNSGPGAAANVTVTDATPANTTFVSSAVTTGSGWTKTEPAVGGTGNVVFSKSSVAVGETATFTIVVKVNSSTPNNTTITNSATAASTTADTDSSDNTDATMTNAIRRIDLAVTKTDTPDPVIAGSDITYTINFANNGPSDASNVTVSDAVPANTSLVSAVVTTGTGWSTNTSGPIVFSKSAVTAGETAVFTIVVHVASNTASGVVISNSVTASATETDTNSGNNMASATTDVITRADLVVTKTDSPDPVNAGNNLTYTINFSNAGPSDAQTVTVTDAVPANTTLVSAVVTTGTGWSVNLSGPIVFSKATVVAGETAVFTMVVKVNSNTASGTTISNSATAASTTTDPTPGNNTGMASTTVQTSADLAVTKTDTPDPSFAGNNITYTIGFTNNGPSDAQTVTVTDAVPANTTFVSSAVTTGSGWTKTEPAVGGTGNVVFSKATVAAGETATFTIVVKVDAMTPTGTTITNTATAATTTTDPTPGNNSATATTSVQTQTDLVVTTTDSPDPVIAGNNLTYTINFSNAGPSDAQTVTVTDAVPANTTFVSSAVTTGSGWTKTEPAVGGTGNVVFSKATVMNGETAVFTIVVKVNANTANGTTITDSAVAASTTGDSNSGNNTGTAMTTVTAQADLAVTKTDSPDPVIAGTNLTYTINFSNNGPSDAQTVTVSDAVPANTSFVSATVTTGTGWSTDLSGPIVFSKATVAAGETAVFTMVVKVNANTANGATISNSVTAATTTTDPTPGNNSATATTTVQAQADLAVTKTDSPDPVFAGNNLTYTIGFTNNGPSDAQTVTVTDAVPANTTFVSSAVTTGTGWTKTEPAVGGTGNVVFSKATVAAGETAVFTMVVKVNANTANGATISNSVTAATTTTDPTPGNNSATATTTVQTQTDLAVTKTDSPDPVVASQNLTYTITLNNNGPSDAQTVTVTDAVPANTTFVSATVTTGTGWTKTEPAVGGTGNVVFSKATVAAGETAVFTIVVKVDAAAANNSTITNTATAATSTTDSNSGNNSATATTTVLAQADLAVTKSDSPDPVCVNGNLTYTINFVDNGPGPGLNTTVTDAVPANTTFVSSSVMTGTGWTKTEPAVGGTGNVVFSKANVASGETATFIIVVKVNAGTLHGTTISNSVTAASSITDPTPGNNTAMATTTVDPIAPTITCPAPIIIAAVSGQCSAPATFAPTTNDNCAVASTVCSPASGSSFPVGTTTVMCTATDTAGNTASCSFTVKVNDTQPPTFPNGCPAAISTVTPVTCPLSTTQTVTYATPAIMDNCPGATVTCVPPSGSVFATGTTSVTCTATDASGNTATCSFAVRVWTGCLQDESNPGNVVLFDAQTGDYQFCCNGVVIVTGTATLTVRGCTVSFDHIKGNRRVKITADMAVKRGTATVIIYNFTTCTITDQNMANNTCACPVATKVAKP